MRSTEVLGTNSHVHGTLDCGPFTEIVQHKLLKHLGFLLEAFVEAIPQAVRTRADVGVGERQGREVNTHAHIHLHARHLHAISPFFSNARTHAHTHTHAHTQRHTRMHAHTTEEQHI